MLKKHKGIIKVYLLLNSSLKDPVLVGKFYHAEQHEKADVFLRTGSKLGAAILYRLNVKIDGSE
jgi:hypothetical protein